MRLVPLGHRLASLPPRLGVLVAHRRHRLDRCQPQAKVTPEQLAVIRWMWALRAASQKGVL